jgi:thiopurine S-methyltransferase
MGDTFWDKAWAEGRIGFHQAGVHVDLLAAAPWFLAEGPHRVLVPLCGKTVDLAWLGEQGHEVVGVELTEQGARAFFSERGLVPTEAPRGAYTALRAGRITILRGDIFDLHTAGEAPFTRIWDRAAMIALPPELRAPYQQLIAGVIASGATLLLNVLEYDATRMSGPPFCVPAAEVEAAFAHLPITLLDREDQMDDRWRERGHEWMTRHLYRVGTVGT